MRMRTSPAASVEQPSRGGVTWMAGLTRFLFLLTPATMARTYLWGAATLVVVWTTLYLVWVHLLHLTYPVPMIGAIACIAGAITC